jgi:hypothetical protein
MPVIGQLTALIGGGALFVGDSETQGDDLGESGPHPVVDVGPGQIIVRVQNGAADGATTVRIAAPAVDDPVGPVAFDDTLNIPSGLLRVGDGVDRSVLWIRVPAGDVRVRLHVDALVPDFYSPGRVDIVLPEI